MLSSMKGKQFTGAEWKPVGIDLKRGSNEHKREKGLVKGEM